MYVAFRMLYREGIKLKSVTPPVPGQIISDDESGLSVLHFWPVDWVHHTTWPKPSIATLWHPTLGGIGHCNLVIRGLEAVRKGSVRRWSAQKWVCEVIDRQRAVDFYKPNMLRGEVPSSIPRSPPPLDPDRPFG